MDPANEPDGVVAPLALETLTSLEGSAWSGFLRAHARLLRDMSAELEARHGLELTSYDVLRQLAVAPGRRLRMTALAERVMLSRPGLTGIVGRLEAAGLVERVRAPDDGRSIYATLTPAGERAVRAAHATHIESIRERFTTRLTQDDLTALQRVWSRL